jgi:hypothetical protein
MFTTPAPAHVHLGDALAWLCGLPEAPADAVVTDPPYSKGVPDTDGQETLSSPSGAARDASAPAGGTR